MCMQLLVGGVFVVKVGYIVMCVGVQLYVVDLEQVGMLVCQQEIENLVCQVWVQVLFVDEVCMVVVWVEVVYMQVMQVFGDVWVQVEWVMQCVYVLQMDVLKFVQVYECYMQCSMQICEEFEEIGVQIEEQCVLCVELEVNFECFDGEFVELQVCFEDNQFVFELFDELLMQVCQEVCDLECGVNDVCFVVCNVVIWIDEFKCMIQVVYEQSECVVVLLEDVCVEFEMINEQIVYIGLQDVFEICVVKEEVLQVVWIEFDDLIVKLCVLDEQWFVVECLLQLLCDCIIEL